MARHQYSAEERNQIFARFIAAANQIMDEEGPDAVTTRRVAQLAGYKSSTLYHYFIDLDHLIMYASMKYLRDYNSNLAVYISDLKGTYLRFRSIWEFFCDSAFRYPDAFHRLFFGKHRDDLEEVIRTYYQVFPDELVGLDDIVLDMLHYGSIMQRNMSIMVPMVEAGYVSAERAPTVNEIIVHCFQALLEEKLLYRDQLDNFSLTERHQLYITTVIG